MIFDLQAWPWPVPVRATLLYPRGLHLAEDYFMWIAILKVFRKKLPFSISISISVPSFNTAT